jgi:RNA polymerase sigma factor (TIGR02999 family)
MDPLKDLLQKAHEGNEAARAQLFAVAYDELRTRARAQLQCGGRNTLLNTTVLVHESYMRYLNAGHLSSAERGYFFSYAAHVMRSVIVDFARQRQAQRRGGNAVRPHRRTRSMRWYRATGWRIAIARTITTMLRVTGNAI